MAPAKSDRANARRRYRAYLQEEAEGDEGMDEETPEVEAKPKSSRAAEEPQIRPGQRVGMGQAFRLAVRQVHYLDDIRYLPTLITKTNAVWIPALISVGSLIYGLTRTDYNDGTIQILLGLLLAGGSLGAPALLQPLVAGYFAPRASWLAGGISGIISSVCFTILVAYWFAPTPHLANLPAEHLIIDQSNIGSVLFPSLVGGIAFGALLSAASAWYKRFLNLLSGNTRQPSGKPQRTSGRR